MKSSATDIVARTRNKLHLSVSNDLESRILSGELPVGERLPSEGEIARIYGVSTRSVREAVQTLETKGLVRRHHGERTVVVRDDVSKFLDTLASTVRQQFSTEPNYLIGLMEVRRMIEIEVLGILMESARTMNAEVEEALSAMRRACDTHDFAGFTVADAAFHRGLVHSAGNEILSAFYDSLYGLITDVIRVASRVPSKPLKEAFAEHAAIHEKIRKKDETGAKALMRAQIDNSAAYLRVAIQNANRRNDSDD